MSSSPLQAAFRVLLSSASGARVTAVQEAAATCAVQGFSVFLHLPTGAGKSLAFQAPALAAPPGRPTLVVSPLLALMHVCTCVTRYAFIEESDVDTHTRVNVARTK